MIFALLCLSTVAIGILLARTYRTLGYYQFVQASRPLSEPPSVSVCIAARNETHALAQCLERVLKSDYKKLEVLVLDDSSTDDTSLIIKSFANAGVRFIPGKALPDGWLGKNHAYQILADEASGDVLLYIDVDTKLENSSISKIVGWLETTNLSMVSLLPRREDTERLSALVGTMRYYWELLLGTKQSPPASSAIWMVRADVLKQDGIGLAHYGMSVRPERHLARQLQRNDSYRYAIGTKDLGVSYEKHLPSQYETALRLYYPATGRNIFLWASASLYLMLLLAPIGLLIFVQWNIWMSLWSTALIVLTALSFGMFVQVTYGGPLKPLRIAVGPLLVVQELVLLASSYFRYRHGAVTWKGRLVNAQPEHRDALELNE
ncbi:MAG: glycosyltransferase family 2 protein [Patescibacteria group bacterium]